MLRFAFYRALRGLAYAENGISDAPVSRVDPESFAANLAELNAACEADEARLVLIEPALQKGDGQGRRVSRYRRELHRFSEEHTVPLVSVPRLIEAPDATFFLDNFHPNEKGHALLADALFETLTREKLLPEAVRPVSTRTDAP